VAALSRSANSRNYSDTNQDVTSTAGSTVATQAEESQQKQSADQRKAEGINTASDQHQVDIYI
jgi:hypothetical protein